MSLSTSPGITPWPPTTSPPAATYYEWFIGARVLFHSGDWLRDVLAAYVEARGEITVTDELRIIPVN